MTNTHHTTPLAEYRIVAMRENWYSPVPEVKQPGGCCWHCGTGIAIEVVIQSSVTGEQHTIGTTCAERVGMDTAELKTWLAERYADQRAEAARLRSAEYRAEREAFEAEQVARHGEHGTESRFLSGCYCDPCVAAAPHGTTQRFWSGKCRCLDCITAVAALPEMHYITRTVIVDVETGKVVDAKLVDGQWGSRWCVENGKAWLGLSPKRRSTQANKGYVEAEAMFLTERIKTRNGPWYKPLVRVSDPIVDAWGETIRQEATA